MMPPIRVLVVDDSTVIRKILCDALTSDPGIQVAGTASDGRIALAKIPQLNPDIITLDVEMPNMSGLETIVEIRKLYPNRFHRISLPERRRICHPDTLRGNRFIVGNQLDDAAEVDLLRRLIQALQQRTNDHGNSRHDINVDDARPKAIKTPCIHPASVSESTNGLNQRDRQQLKGA